MNLSTAFSVIIRMRNEGWRVARWQIRDRSIHWYPWWNAVLLARAVFGYRKKTGVSFIKGKQNGES